MKTNESEANVPTVIKKYEKPALIELTHTLLTEGKGFPVSTEDTAFGSPIGPS
ncbi:hypothetical protein [Sphingorhabdus sp. SMR4y]|uniref:hypothetical protein n=1 Tax=Sphingorhabdus sp. SMR4y TaxID=2584094 RepID=UPI000B5EC28C|nr:hypothetical protein [Sphingorhabdus sp. SMR4y]ASK88258.1 hypothetical protein SPHFLASMR4Y_01509 [Sphingorhabdus sp. SMR4y]